MLYIPHLMTHLLCFSVGSYFFQITVSCKIYISVKNGSFQGFVLVLEIQKCSAVVTNFILFVVDTGRWK